KTAPSAPAIAVAISSAARLGRGCSLLVAFISVLTALPPWRDDGSRERASLARKRRADSERMRADFEIGAIRVNENLVGRRGGMRGVAAAKLGGGHADARLEGAVERAHRVVAEVERDRQHRSPGLGLRAQPRAGLRDAVAVEEIVEVAVAELAIDDAPKHVLLRAERAGQRADGEALATIERFGSHAPLQLEEQRSLRACGTGGRRFGFMRP